MKVKSLYSSFPDFIPNDKDNLIQLNNNENPFEVPPSPLEDIRESLLSIKMNRYPDPSYRALRESLAYFTGYDSEKIVLGNGGDEILWILFAAFAGPERHVLTLSPCFSEYYHLCNVFRSMHIQVPLDLSEKGFSIERETLLQMTRDNKPSLVIIDNPNNPSGLSLDNGELIDLINEAPCPVVIDEAYGEFADSTLMGYFREREMPDNLFILKTFSKAWGLAGIRLGYGLCGKPLFEKFNSVRSPFNVNILTGEVARIMLSYREWMESRVYSIKFMRDRFIHALNSVKGWQAFESNSNFVLARTDLELSLVKKAMDDNMIHLRYPDLPGYEGNWIRISIGKEAEMRRLLDTISNLGK